MAIRAVGAHTTATPKHVDTSATLPSGTQAMFVWDDTAVLTRGQLQQILRDLSAQALRSSYFTDK